MTKRYEVFLTRNYVVHIKAESKEEACSNVEFYLGDCEDLSNEFEQANDHFQIEKIKPAINEAFGLKKFQRTLTKIRIFNDERNLFLTIRQRTQSG